MWTYIEVTKKLATSKPKIHPAATLFPMLTEDELRELAADIQDHGLQVPLVRTVTGELLDGRNRWLACQMAGVEPAWETYEGDPWRYVVSMNLHRRHLSDKQRAMIAAKMANLAMGSNQWSEAEMAKVDAWQLAFIERQGGAALGSAINTEGAKVGYDKETLRRSRKRLKLVRTGNGPDWIWRGGADTPSEVPTPPTSAPSPPTHAQAAELLNVSKASVDRSRMVIHHGTPALQKAVEDDVIPLSSAARTAMAYSPDEQNKVVQRLRNGEKWRNVVPSQVDAPDRRDLRQLGLATTQPDRRPPGSVRTVIDHAMTTRLVAGLDGYHVGLTAVEHVGADVTPDDAAHALRVIDRFGKTLRKVQRLLREAKDNRE